MLAWTQLGRVIVTCALDAQCVHLHSEGFALALFQGPFKSSCSVTPAVLSKKHQLCLLEILLKSWRRGKQGKGRGDLDGARKE